MLVFFYFTYSNKCLGIPHSGLNLNFPNGFPLGSVRKESSCNAGDQGLIPGSGRSHGRKWQPAPVFLENSIDRGACQATVHGVSRVGNDLATKPPPMVSSIPSTCLQYLSEVSLLPFAPFQIGLLFLLKSELSLYIHAHTIFKCVIFR